MSERLWTGSYTRMCVANGLLFASLGTLLPSLPMLMDSKLHAMDMGSSLNATGAMFLYFVLGALLVAPFYAYLVDAYKRKYVCVLSFAVMAGATFGYTLVENMVELIAINLLHGIAFGIATSSAITIAIDITNSTLRSAGNIRFSWAGRVGMFVGIIGGTYIGYFQGIRIVYSPIDNLSIISMIIGGLGVLVMLFVHVPFRAPIVTNYCSLDRFLLLRGWVPAINLVIIALLPGIFIPMIVAVFFMFLMSSVNQLLATSNLLYTFCIPLFCIAFILAYLLVSHKFLRMFVNLSHHCQRATANVTHLLASGLGIALGIAILYWGGGMGNAVYIAGVVFCVALLFYIFITRPYYKRKIVR